MHDVNSLILSDSVRNNIVAKKKHDSAFVMFIIKGDDYITGAIVACASIKIWNVSADMICLVTPDVSAAGIDRLLHVFDIVVPVPYITYETTPFQKGRECKLYSEWIDSSFTRWHCLQLDMYKAVCNLDCDLVAYRNLSSIFQTDPPAAVFKFVDRHLQVPGEKIPWTRTNPRDNKRCTPWGGCVLLQPSISDFLRLVRLVSTSIPYGFPPKVFGADEQSIAHLYYDKKVEWTQLGLHYFLNYSAVENGLIPSPNRSDHLVFRPMLHHFISFDKPWKVNYDKWPDLILWWQFAYAMRSKFSTDKIDYLLGDLSLFSPPLPDTCVFCQLVNERKMQLRESVKWDKAQHLPQCRYNKHHMLSERGNIMCPCLRGRTNVDLDDML